MGRLLRGTILTVALLLPVLSGCSAVQAQTPADRNSAATPPSGPSSSGPTVNPCGVWGCEQKARFDAAGQLISRTSGHLGIVVADRVTGAVWRAGETNLPIWAGSTPKLAFVVALKEDEAAGKITLRSQDNQAIDAMLAVSDNNAADALWDRYANSAAMMQRWRTVYGMTTASYVDGFVKRWGFVKCTPEDLVNLMLYILNQVDPAIRTFLVNRMRSVGGPQQWGVWGAGPALRPGVKDGWDYAHEAGSAVDRWVTSTVGFAGPAERYVIGAMYDQVPGEDSIDAGVHVLTDLVATVFGSPVPAPAVVPPDY